MSVALLVAGGNSLAIPTKLLHSGHFSSSSSHGHHASSFSALPSVGSKIHQRIASALSASTFNRNDLESIFYSFDADSSGEIDMKELKAALDNLGLVASKKDVKTLFLKYDKDKRGTINMKEFKQLISDDIFANALPQREITYAMDLFRKFDRDNSGSIDKNEFLGVARKMRSDSTRRELISVAAAAYGAFLVSESSYEFQFAQKKFRSQYVEESAEISQQLYFPTAMLSSDTDKAIARTLGKRDFTPDNTLFAHSICSDEVNNRKEQLIPLMVNRWKEGFFLGGLGGLPFAGKSGFGAYLHHVPDKGKLLIIFAPHVGIDADGRVGVLQRDGQASVSTACGAAVGAYKALQAKKKSPVDPLLILESLKKEDDDLFDPQIKEIVGLLAPRLQGIEDSADSVAFVTYQMFAIIRDLMYSIIQQTADLHDYAAEVSVVGGIIINRRKGGDFFQPLSFETCKNGEPPVDLFEETFGPRPDLTVILGSDDAVSRLYAKQRR